MPGVDQRPREAGRHPLDRLPRLPGRAGASGWRERDPATVPRRRLHQRPADGGARRGYPADLRRDRRARRAHPSWCSTRTTTCSRRRRSRAGRRDPWTPTHKDDGRIYGRGAADDNSGLVAHLGTLRVFDGKPPCTVKLILEGMEETESNLEAFVEAHPELFACDLFVICDMGNLRVGEPALTTALRGDVACVVTVRTLEHPLHSGVFGGPAPDAMMALARLLSTLHDDDGNVAVDGVSEPAVGRRRPQRGRLPGQRRRARRRRSSSAPGRVGDRLWAHPSINAIGVDMTNIAGSSNVLIPEASAKISMRIVPGSEPEKELDALVAHLEIARPVGRPGRGRSAPRRPRRSSARPTARATPPRASALEEAFGKPAGEAGSRRLDPAAPHPAAGRAGAEFILWGPEDVAAAPASTPPTRASTRPRSSGWSWPRPCCCSAWRAGDRPEPTRATRAAPLGRR